MVKTINNANFTSVLEENNVTVIDFWAEWCGPCRLLGPIVDKVAASNLDISIGKVNVDDNSDLAAKFGIRNIPTLLFMKDGEVVTKTTGIKTESQIQEIIDSLK
jgi:thioredoxin 1